MRALFNKEIRSFFSSLTGYVVIFIFLSLTGLLLWVVPDTEFNIPDNGYATLDGLFLLAPWVFLFLIPAVTMRMFSEEHRTGTIELLLTQPLTDMQIVTAKYAAAMILCIIALLPASVYFFSLSYLAYPAGNVDVAGISGSFIGLLFLASGFASIGIFSSALTSNQIVSFLFAVILCFFFFSGFEFLAALDVPFADIVSRLGISSHYASLSRGVIDTRDVVYFVSLTLLFLFLSRFILERRKW